MKDFIIRKISLRYTPSPTFCSQTASITRTVDGIIFQRHFTDRGAAFVTEPPVIRMQRFIEKVYQSQESHFTNL